MIFEKSVSGDAEIVKWMDNPENIVYFAHEVNYEGFRLEMMNSPYPYLLKDGKEGSGFEVRFHRTGEFYLSFQIKAGREAVQKRCRFAALIDREPVGEFELDADDGRYYLFCTESPIEFQPGIKKVRLEVLEGDGVTATCMAFTKTPFFTRKNAIENLTAAEGKVRFTTINPSQCRITYGGLMLEEESFINCHAFDILPEPGLENFIIRAEEKDGSAVERKGVVTLEQPKKLLKEEPFSYELFYEKRSVEKTPVCAFYGFSKGERYCLENPGITDADGRVYPCDYIVTSCWEDGSIRTVSMTAVIIPDGRSYYFASDVEEVSGEEFDVRDEQGMLKLQNEGEKLCFAVEDVSLLPDLPSATALYIQGSRLEPALGAWQIKKAGNAEIVLEREGRFSAQAKEQKLYLKLAFYRGIPGFKMEIALENGQREPRLFNLDGWYLEFVKKHEAEAGEETLSVYQIDDQWAAVNDQLIEKRCEGDFGLEHYDVHLADFWQNYPKSIECRDGQAVVGLLPFIKHQEIYDAYSEYDRVKLLYCIHEGKYWMHLGMRRIFTFGFSRSKEEARRLTEAVFLRPACESIERSEAFGKILCCCPDTADFDSVIEEGYEFLLQMREKKREYGMFNYGDWHGENHMNWGNCEYDMPYAGLMQFLRGAGEKYARLGLMAAQHMEQVDYIRVNPNESVEGLFFLHRPGHSNYYPWAQNPDLIDQWDIVCAHRGHLFVQGLADWYKVTGEECFRDAVLHCADNLCTDYCTCVDFDVERVPAWVMLSLLAAYELKTDRKYLNGCRLIVERVCFKQDKRTGMIPSMLTRSETEGKIFYTGKPFMCGLLMSALHRYYLHSGDATAETVMDGIARWLVYEMWDEEAQGFWYTGYSKLHNIHTYPSTSIEILEGLLYLYEKNRDPRIHEIALKAMKRTCSLEYREFDVGKNMAMRMRFAPVILRVLYGRKENSE